MKTRLLTLGMLFLGSSLLSQTQDDGRGIFERSDKKLNEIYQNLLAVKQSDTVFVRNLRSSERAWIQFRDAQLALKYPGHPSLEKLSPDEARYLSQLTEDRSAVLLEWLKASMTWLDTNEMSPHRSSFVQMGSESMPQNTRWTEDAWTLVYKVSVMFPVKFRNIPLVQLSISAIEAYSRKNGTFVRLEKENVTSSGFQLNVYGAYMDSFSNCTVNWMAVEPGLKQTLGGE